MWHESDQILAQRVIAKTSVVRRSIDLRTGEETIIDEEAPTVDIVKYDESPSLDKEYIVGDTVISTDETGDLEVFHNPVMRIRHNQPNAQPNVAPRRPPPRRSRRMKHPYETRNDHKRAGG